MEGAVELAVAAAAESVSCCLAARCGDRCDAGEPGEGRLRSGVGRGVTRRRAVAQQRSARCRARRAAAVQVRARGRAARARALRPRLSQLRSGGRGCAGRAGQRPRRCSAALVRRRRLHRARNLPIRSVRSSSRRLSGAVTITARSCPSASRRTSTALPCDQQQPQRLTPFAARGRASVSLASAARAVRTASRASSLPRSRRSLCGTRLSRAPSHHVPTR